LRPVKSLQPSPTVQVWDPLVRVFHWTLALSFAAAWATAEHMERLHELIGYFAGALVAVRVLWGFLGPRYARFSQFVRPPSAVLAYLKAAAAGSERRFLGHNPAGGAMIVILLAAIAATAVTGWLMTTDAFWGSTAMQAAHAVAAYGVLLLVCVHLGGVALASLRHRENLPLAMVSGGKRAPRHGDVV